MDREAGAVAAAEQRAAEIVREAEEEAFRILEQAATVAFKGKRAARPDRTLRSSRLVPPAARARSRNHP